MCLVLVASTSAYGLQLTAAATLQSPDAANQATATSTRKVLIITVDPITGEREQMECALSSSTFASDVVLVQAQDFSSIARICNGAGAPESAR
jgi:hypothetical protein